jgi:AraC-like DNA-binding protein
VDGPSLTSPGVGCLYERAAPASEDLDALWHLDSGRTFFAGPLDYNASHQHGAPVYLSGLYGRFGLRVDGGRWLSVRTAVIPAGVRHELQLGGQPIGVFYIEPDLAGTEALAPLVRDTSEDHGALVGRGGEVLALRALYEDRTATRWAGSALSDLLGFARRRARRELDPRVARAVAAMQAGGTELTPVARLAGEAGLSPSRFQHLFTREVGVPFRRYRAWQRMRAAIAEIVRGRSFTTAAHAVGFADQAHFAHDFRRTFGAPASRSLAKVRR